jgi:hypothetical protein
MQHSYKTAPDPNAIRIGRFHLHFNGDKEWISSSPFDIKIDEVRQRLVALRSKDDSEQLNGLGWLYHQMIDRTFIIGPGEVPRIVELLESPNADVRQLAMKLTRHLLTFPSDLGMAFLRSPLLDFVSKFHSGDLLAITADLLLTSVDAQHYLLERGIVGRLLEHFQDYPNADFVRLAGGCVRRQNMTPEYETLFRMVASLLEAADAELNCLIVMSMRLFLDADPAFADLFLDLDILGHFLNHPGETVDWEREFMFLLIVLITRYNGYAERLVDCGICVWIQPRITGGPNLRFILYFLANLFLQAQNSAAFVLDLAPIVCSFFDRGEFEVKSLVLSFLTASVLVWPAEGIADILPCLPIVLESPSLIPAGNHCQYLAALRKLLDGPVEVAAEFVQADELIEWLNGIAGNGSEVAERADDILGKLQAIEEDQQRWDA